MSRSSKISKIRGDVIAKGGGEQKYVCTMGLESIHSKKIVGKKGTGNISKIPT